MSIWTVPSKATLLHATTAEKAFAALAPLCPRGGIASSVLQMDGTRGAGGELGCAGGPWIR